MGDLNDSCPILDRHDYRLAASLLLCQTVDLLEEMLQVIGVDARSDTYLSQLRALGRVSSRSPYHVQD